MKKFYFLALSLLLSACSSLSDSEVIMKASPEERPAKPHMPLSEKPLPTPHNGDQLMPLAPQIGVRVPLK